MLRKNLLVIILGLSVIVLAILGYLNMSQDPKAASPFESMPPSTSAVLSINDYARTFDNILMNNLMWQELRLDSSVDNLASDMILLDSLISTEEIAEDLRWFLSFHVSGNSFARLITLPTSSYRKERFVEWFQGYADKIESYGVFEEVEIFQCDFKQGLFGTVYFAHDRDMLLVSARADLVEDALRSLHSDKNLYADKEFRKVEKTAGNFADWNFYVNMRNISSLKLLGLNLKELSESDIVWSGWSALDATVHPDLFLLNGFSEAGSESYLSLFEKQKSQDIDAIEVIPEDVSLFFHFGVSNYKNYSKSKRAYFKKTGRDKQYSEHVAEVKEEHGLDLENELDQWVANEFGVMFLKQPGIAAEDAKVVYFRLADMRRATAILENLSRQEAGDESKIHQLPVENMLDGFETVLFNGLNKPYYTIVDKYLLLSTHEDLVQRVRTQYLQANTLRKSEMYARFSSNLSDQSNVYLYVHLEKGMDVYDRLLNEESLSFLSGNPTFREKFEQVGIQFKDGKNDMFYQHLALNFDPKERSQGNVLWEAVLDTDLLIKPQIVYNHYTNAREILVQDVSNTIYLIDNKGNLLWKKQMKEPILSKVYQIDVYKNNKLQMLFNGESSIYLLDRKGRFVENFPVQLPALATNALKVIDYEKNREYRILIGVRGGQILNYDQFGRPVKGWKFKTEEEITYPIDYFLLNNKDYIVTAGATGKPYVLNRRGDERVKVNEYLPADLGKGFTLELSNEINQCRFVTTDESGNFIKLKFNGEKEIVNLDLISQNHQFLYDDVNNDRKNDYVLLDSNKLMVFDHGKEKMFEIELEGNDPEYLSLYRFEAGYGKIGFTDGSSGQLYLYRDAGGLDNNFPLKGHTAFTITDINKDGRQNVIVGVEDRLVVYNLQ